MFHTVVTLKIVGYSSYKSDARIMLVPRARRLLEYSWHDQVDVMATGTHTHTNEGFGNMFWGICSRAPLHCALFGAGFVLPLHGPALLLPWFSCCATSTSTRRLKYKLSLGLRYFTSYDGTPYVAAVVVSVQQLRTHARCTSWTVDILYIVSNMSWYATISREGLLRHLGISASQPSTRSGEGLLCFVLFLVGLVYYLSDLS